MEFSQFTRTMQRQEPVIAAIKMLEQRHGLNPNILWYCIWYAQRPYGRLRKQHFPTLEQSQHPWHDKIFITLRNMQQDLSGVAHAKALRIRTWLMEEMYHAQDMQQDFLQQALATWKVIHRSASQQLLDACSNLALYFRVRNLSWDEVDREMLNIILHNVFPNSVPAVIRQGLTDAIMRAQVNAAGFEQMNLM